MQLYMTFLLFLLQKYFVEHKHYSILWIIFILYTYSYLHCCTDVNGKVIHLVQRAPPQPESRSNNSDSQRQNNNQSWPQARLQYRGHLHRNAMYLGAMSVPTEAVEGHGNFWKNFYVFMIYIYLWVYYHLFKLCFY